MAFGDLLAIVTLVSRMVLGGTFVLAATAKMRDHSAFVAHLTDYRLLIGVSTRSLGQIIPIVEFTLGVWLLVGIYLQIAAAFALMLLATFSAAVLVGRIGGGELRCLCFGMGNGTAGRRSIVRNLVLGVFSAILVVAPNSYSDFSSVVLLISGL